MRKLLADGRTDSLADFVSQRTRRKFKAFLVRDTAGKIGFEFAPRPERPGRPAAARSATPTDEKPAVKPAKTPAKKPVKSVTTKAATIKAPAKATAKKKSTAKATPPNG
jgi:DNA topoisomerase-3